MSRYDIGLDSVWLELILLEGTLLDKAPLTSNFVRIWEFSWFDRAVITCGISLSDRCIYIW